MSKESQMQAAYAGETGQFAPAPPGHTAAGVMLAAPPNRMRMDAFNQELCGCCEDGDTCLTGFFCPCCAHGILCHDIEEKGYCMHCMVWLGATLCVGGCAPPLLGTMARIRLRDKYGLAGDKFEDCCLHIFCNPCALAQELRFLKSIGRLNLARGGQQLYQPLPSHGAAPSAPVGTHARV